MDYYGWCFRWEYATNIKLNGKNYEVWSQSYVNEVMLDEDELLDLKEEIAGKKKTPGYVEKPLDKQEQKTTGIAKIQDLLHDLRSSFQKLFH